MSLREKYNFLLGESMATGRRQVPHRNLVVAQAVVEIQSRYNKPVCLSRVRGGSRRFEEKNAPATFFRPPVNQSTTQEEPGGSI